MINRRQYQILGMAIFKYQVIYFDLFNAEASLNKYINKTFNNKLHIFIIVYVDNILVYTKDSS